MLAVVLAVGSSVRILNTPSTVSRARHRRARGSEYERRQARGDVHRVVNRAGSTLRRMRLVRPGGKKTGKSGLVHL
jgi:hypothetical protein